MPFKTLSASLSVAPQLTAGDVAEAARAGFRAIIDNRPDGEEPGQPTAAEIRDLAASHGMSFAHVPTLGGAVADEHVMQMAQTLARLDGPALAYCRTGMRSATLWALTQGAINNGGDRSGTNSNYANGVNLRGLGSDATLVLINGRRLAGTGSKGDFVDVSTIPTAAVERVDILLDGASA